MSYADATKLLLQAAELIADANTKAQKVKNSAMESSRINTATALQEIVYNAADKANYLNSIETRNEGLLEKVHAKPVCAESIKTILVREVYNTETKQPKFMATSNTVGKDKIGWGNSIANAAQKCAEANGLNLTEYKIKS